MNYQRVRSRRPAPGWFPNLSPLGLGGPPRRPGIRRDAARPRQATPATSPRLAVLDRGPFYAIQITPYTNDSFGTVPISTKAECVDADRNPVPGLYAAGTLGNVEMFYLRYAVSGASLCMGTVTGRTAAQSAMEYLGL